MANKHSRGRSTILLSACGILLLAAAASAADVPGLMRKGNGLYGRGKYDEALSHYQMAEVLEPDATAIHYNIGNTLYRLGRYEEALRELELVSIDKKPGRRAAAAYNTGNVLFKAGQLDGAIKAYTAALVFNPNDKQAKQNLEFCLRKKEEQQKQQKQGQNNQQQQNQQQNQQQQQQQMQQPQQGMSKDQAERILQAVEDKDKEQQKRQRQAGGKRNVEQDW